MLKPLLPLSFFLLSNFCINAQGVKSSVLSDGSWIKVGVQKSGIYKISYQDLKQAGVNTEGINPKHISVYGNGGAMLPQQIAYPRPIDLFENPITVTGEADGVFEDGDQITFYAESPHVWSFDINHNQYLHTYNLYSDTNFYFIRLDNPLPGKRVQEKSIPAGTAVVNTFDEVVHYEKDVKNFLSSGRFWYGETFDTILTRTFEFDMSDFVGDSFQMEISLVGSANVATSAKLYAGETLIDEVVFDTYGNLYYYPICDVDTRTYTIPKSSIVNGKFVLKIDHNKNGDNYPRGGMMLDYINLFYLKKIDETSGQFAFRSKEVVNPGVFNFRFPAISQEYKIWEISGPTDIAQKNIVINSDSIEFAVQGGDMKEFVTFRNSDAFSPASLRKINNQNIHGVSNSPKLIIVTNPQFKSQAEKLALYRRSNDGMNVLVVTTDEVYNEFSSGKQDVTAIRDLARHFYSMNGGNDSLKYLLLFGDASYDYKNRISNNTNYVPIYLSRQSLNPLKAYSSDDYYGFMQDNEGYWDENSMGNSTMDIGVGRLPIRTVEEANAIVNKIINYGKESSVGEWPNKVTFIADDDDNNLHLNDSEKHVTNMERRFPHLQSQKLYIDYFLQTPSNLGGGERSQEFANALKSALDEGTLLVNFVGHGGPPSLGNERLMDKDGVDKWKNKHLPLFITATCEFALVDQPLKFSLGKYLVLKEEGGGIGIISGTRPAFSSANFSLNSALMRFAFNPTFRLGDVVRNTKNSSFSDVYNRHFVFIGDPSLRLDIPENSAEITSLTKNGQAINDTLNALSKITLNGLLRDKDGNVLNDFSGNAVITLYDKESYEVTRGYGSPAKRYKVRKNIVSEVRTSVENGAFTTDLVLPLSFSDDSIAAAKFVVYAYSSDGKSQAAGATLKYYTGGVDPDAAPDNEAPVINVVIDDDGFENGDSVSPNAAMLADLSDENGINTSNKNKDHLIVALLNDDSTIVLNKYYKTDLFSIKNGKIYYNFKSLPEGNYTLEVRASDTYHNRATRKINFVVIDTFTSVTLPVNGNDEYLAYPNPFNSEINLQVRSSVKETRQIEIFNVSGIRIKTIVYNNTDKEVKWDGCDENGIKMEKGMYICRFQNENGGNNKSKSLLIIKQ